MGLKQLVAVGERGVEPPKKLWDLQIVSSKKEISTKISFIWNWIAMRIG